MYRRILLAYDGTPESQLALQACLNLPLDNAELVIVAVVHDLTSYSTAGEYVPALAFEQDTDAAENDIATAKAFLAEHGKTATTRVELGEPVDVIARLVKELEIDLLVIGHKRELSFAARLLRGSTGAGLMERVRCGILIAPATDN
jgi:nucleotide-binding universal stress UspA family protein